LQHIDINILVDGQFGFRPSAWADKVSKDWLTRY
jgi:hypothetical protein